MSFRKNLVANFLGQIYATLAGIVVVPLYVRYMGAESYGLVGFFAVLQAWCQLLDVGLTPTMARETARYNGGATDALSLRRLLRALEVFFVSVAVFGFTLLNYGVHFIAIKWLKVQHLPLAEVERAILLMGAVVALRWICGLYRGVINGFERLVWLNSFNVLVASARFILVLPVLVWRGATPTTFFTYQLVVAVFEVLVLSLKTYQLLPNVTGGHAVSWDWKPLRGVLGFSLTIAFTSSLSVFVTQTDKLVLSKLLPLSDYAYFTLGVLVASGVTIATGPISGALIPRLTKLSAEGDDDGLVRLYRNSTQLVAIIAVPAALVLACFSESVIWSWTGDVDLARKAAPVLALYAIGNGIQTLAAFPYYIQFAKGDLRLHIIGSFLYLILLTPTVVWSTLRYGVTGAGSAWIGTNLAYLLLWVPWVHRRFFDTLHQDWFWKDVVPIWLLPVIAAVLFRECFSNWPSHRLAVAAILCGFGATFLALAVVSSSGARAVIMNYCRRRRWKSESLGLNEVKS